MNGRSSFQLYYATIDRVVAHKLNSEDPSYLATVDFNEYLDFLVSDMEWEPLTWDEGQMTIESFTIKRENVDLLFQRRYVADVGMFRLRIPISEHSQRDLYFRHAPSVTRGAEPDWTFGRDASSGAALLIVEVEAAQSAVDNALKDVRSWLGVRNRDIEEGNARLRDIIRPVWEAKRRQVEEHASSTRSLLQELNIPLYQDPNATARPVEIEPRQLRTVIQRPTARTEVPEPSLKGEDVTQLVDFIERYTRQFEVSPKTYGKMDEEELRDLLVGMINANYPGSATAERFSKLGRTDISLQVDSRHILICECKFWSGAKAYAEAIEQLFGYLTWRQSYGVLLHFCRLKDMSRALSEGQRGTSEHPSFTQGSLSSQAETRFSSRHAHPQDSEKLVEVHHIFVDLSVS